MIDKTFIEVENKKKHLEWAKELQTMKTQLHELKKQVGNLESRIVEYEIDLFADGLTLSGVHDYRIQILQWRSVLSLCE